MTEDKLLEYLKSNYPKEDESCDWKAFTNLKHAVNGHEHEDIISYVSGISNMEGGHLVIGVEDGMKNIVGIQNFQSYTTENLKFKLIQECTNVNSDGLYIDSFKTA